jgi:hypothetical protein
LKTFVENCFILKFSKITSSANISVSQPAQANTKGPHCRQKNEPHRSARSDTASRKTRLRRKRQIWKEKTHVH